MMTERERRRRMTIKRENKEMREKSQARRGRQFYRYDETCTFCRISSVISAGTGYMGKIICRT